MQNSYHEPTTSYSNNLALEPRQQSSSFPTVGERSRTALSPKLRDCKGLQKTYRKGVLSYGPSPEKGRGPFNRTPRPANRWALGRSRIVLPRVILHLDASHTPILRRAVMKPRPILRVDPIASRKGFLGLEAS